MMSIKIECFFSSRDEKKKLIILNKIKNITANIENIIQSDNQYSFVIKKLIPSGNILFLMQYKFARR